MSKEKYISMLATCELCSTEQFVKKIEAVELQLLDTHKDELDMLMRDNVPMLSLVKLIRKVTNCSLFVAQGYIAHKY